MKHFATAFAAASLSLASLSAAPMLLAQAVKAEKPVQIELTSKLDSKSAAVGTPIAAKLLEPATIGKETLPTGTKLTGKVTEAKAGSSLSFAFDTAEPKGKAPEAIHADVVSIAPRASLSDAGPNSSDIPMRGTSQQQAAQTGGSMQYGPSDSLPDLAVGSTVKGVTLSPAKDAMTTTLISSKDFKLDSGTRMEVGLWTGSN